MSDFTPWLGLCHIRQIDDNAFGSTPTLVAVWADSVEGFEREVHFHTNTHGLQMIGTEEVLPAADWLAKHPDRKDGQRLAGKVSAKHPVAFGALGGRETDAGVGGETEGQGYLHIEEIEGVEPLDSQFGVHPPKTVPDALYEPLFGQPAPTPAEVAQYGSAEKVPPLNTYAILDAAKVVNFVEMLEASGLEHRCLFKGEAAQEMRDVAPYVVRLEEDVDFTRNLFSHDPEQEVPWFMWAREPGIYIRSRGSLEEMWKHFRKFTKVQDEDGKWYYFRFWEGSMLRLLSESSMNFSTNFFTHSNLAEPFTIIAQKDGGLMSIGLSSASIGEKTQFIVTNSILDILDTEIQKRDMEADIQHVIQDLGVNNTNKLHNSIAEDYKWLASRGFSDRSVLRELLAAVTKTGGIDNLPEAMRESLTDTRIGPKARLWLFKSKTGEI